MDIPGIAPMLKVDSELASALQAVLDLGHPIVLRAHPKAPDVFGPIWVTVYPI